MAMLGSLLGNPLWYVTRATGVVAFIALTAAVVLGVLSLRRVAGRLPRFVTQGVHRTVALTAVGALLVHVATTVLDGYMPIGWSAAVVPFVSGYKVLWVGLGAVALDLVVLVTWTSVLRRRLRYRGWRLVHLSTYPAWLLSIGHYLGVGTDTRGGGALLLSGAGTAAVLAAVVARVAARAEPTRQQEVRTRG
jgi:sulfoxide reductase heme-binding subunit YedZ